MRLYFLWTIRFLARVSKGEFAEFDEFDFDEFDAFDMDDD